MGTYRVVLEIELDEANPLEAAKTVEKWVKEDGEFQYYVQDEETKECFSVDLSEDDEDAVIPIRDYQPLIEK